jgi:ubiquinone/menaquinone biosynthesis C-methylase UbiE
MTAAGESSGPWARKAEALYDGDYARRYRHRDEQLLQEASYQDFIAWLQEICNRFQHPIDVLDLGCGTGRYFWGVHRARTLVGFDASAAMLEQAKHPIRADQITAPSITLIHGDLATHAFPDASFDLVYSIGVLAEHVPLDRALTARVWTWLKPGGRFAFTTVDPQSPDVPRTLPRTLATLALPLLPGALGRTLHRRLMSGGMYGDERWIREVLGDAFVIESVEQFRSDVHLHGRCIARKQPGPGRPAGIAGRNSRQE